MNEKIASLRSIAETAKTAGGGVIPIESGRFRAHFGALLVFPDDRSQINLLTIACKTSW
jgi:hypothetical protein